MLTSLIRTLHSTARVVLKKFLIIDATDRSKISSNQKCVFFAIRLHPLSFLVNTNINYSFLNRFFLGNFDQYNTTVVGDYINTMKKTFEFDFDVN